MNQCYHNGDFWQCVTATSAGESPTSAPEKWRKLKLPSKWRWALAQLTYAYLLQADGQTDKYSIERNRAYHSDNHGIRDLAGQEEQEEQAFGRGCHRGRPARVNTGRTLPIAASVILDDAHGLMNWDVDNLDAREKKDSYRAFSKALQELWEFWWWQELMVCAQEELAPLATDNLLEDLEWTQQAGGGLKSYVQVTGLTVGQVYQLVSADITELSLDAISAGGMNPVNTVATFAAGTIYTFTATQTSYFVWGGADVGETGALGDTLTVPALLLDTYGPLRGVSRHDPRRVGQPGYYELDVTGDGTRVVGLDVSWPWLWWRRVTPVIHNETTDFDAEETYEATDPEYLVYDS